MQLDYIDKINEFGDDLVRLYNFDSVQAKKFRDLIQQHILTNKKELDLKTVDFIEARNCNLIFLISDEDFGIITKDKKTFFCVLTTEGYQRMISLLAPFCAKETQGFQYLYDIDTHTDFLFSPAGTW